MEKYNWIKAYYASQNDDSEHEILVRQEVEQSETFVDDKGNRFHISELDLTRSDYEPQLFNLEEFEKRNKEINQQYQESQAMYMEMLSKMDANAIADHKAKIDEREYWRKLRGEIFASLRKDYHSDLDALNQTEFFINRLYQQEQEFFKDK
jgi:hypothetical protein